MRLRDSVARIPGIGPARAQRLIAAGIATVADFLIAIPFRYEDRRHFSPIAGLEWGKPSTILARFQGVRSIRMRRGLLRVEAVADDGTGAVLVVWHNRYPSFAKSLEGRRAALFGTPVATPRGEMRIENPETETFGVGEESDPVHSGRIVGVYHRVGDVPARLWRSMVRQTLDALSPDFHAMTAPAAQLLQALEEVHFPSHVDSGRPARSQIAREELFVLAARIEQRRAKLRERKGMVLPAEEAIRQLARYVLPFPLTSAQKRAVREIADDLASGRAMARLLQGDVGSGKTVVSGLALLIAAKNGAQGALMAPTEILAEQHAESLSSWLTGAGVRIALLTGRVRGVARRQLLAELAAGNIDVLVGTHALAENPVKFRRLGLVVVDEQHRFGVVHRARLFRKGDTPHVLVMTATPIPRSLAWAIYGELDVSVLDEKPPGRSEVVTRVRDEAGREKVYRFAGERVAAGERVYVVVPAIDERAREIAATRETADRIAAVLPGVPVGVLHGRMATGERQTVLQDFAAGRLPILVATTVIEVGVDVPKATLMVVENAEVFGLAQLHQLRGRVGRSTLRSWCALVVGKDASGDARKRLSVLEQTADGFVIAERDLQARGPGDLMGTRQSGLPPLRVADPFQDLANLAQARGGVLAMRAEGMKLESDLFGYP
ncbi:MAG: ATP-dependent DNA helicase RecG [Acidobacteriota bacterium]